MQKELLLDKTIVIAEIGNNHEGSIKNALKMITEARRSGADMVKFQAGTAEGFARTPADVERYRKYELGKEGYDQIIDYCKRINMPVFFSVWSEEFAEYRNLPYYKIASRQCNHEFIQKYDRLGTIISIPHDYKNPEILNIKHSVLLHCVTQYPTTDPMLERMYELKRAYPSLFVGFSDHTIGVKAAIKAIEMGADVIEKHFSLSHDFGPLRDHAISMTPEELKTICFYASNKSGKDI